MAAVSEAEEEATTDIREKRVELKAARWGECSFVITLLRFSCADSYLVVELFTYSVWFIRVDSRPHKARKWQTVEVNRLAYHGTRRIIVCQGCLRCKTMQFVTTDGNRLMDVDECTSRRCKEVSSLSLTSFVASTDTIKRVWT